MRQPRLRLGFAAITSIACALLLAPAASARKPLISYIDAQETFQLFDAETGQNVSPPPPVPIAAGEAEKLRWGTSPKGRYIVFNDVEKKLHLLDRTTGQQVPLPGIDVSENPNNLTVSDAGLIAFDNNGNDPTYLYDSAKGAFVDAGLGDADPAKPENKLRQPRLSGSGLLLVGTCFDNPMTGCATEEDADSDVFVQDLSAAQRLLTPDEPAGESVDEEHPCINGDGTLIAVERLDEKGSNNKDVYLFERSGAEFTQVEAPDLNDAEKDDRYCELSGDGAYVSLVREEEGGVEEPEFKLYERASGSFVALPKLTFDYRSTLSEPLVVAEPISAPAGKRPKRRKRAKHRKGRGSKSVSCGGRRATIVGSGRRNRLKGTRRRDVIAGLGGNDVIRGLGGNDIVCGGTGADRLLGGRGRDTLLGGRGRDRLRGGPGRDVLRGGPGKDVLRGGPGRDVQKQ
jgi:hypothetical protein